MKGLFFIILLISASTSCSTQNEYKEYIPVFSVDGNFIQIRDSLTEKHKRNIQHVFEYYNMQYKIQANKILYKGDIEEELLWNFTSKANDPNWLISH